MKKSIPGERPRLARAVCFTMCIMLLAHCAGKKQGRAAVPREDICGNTAPGKAHIGVIAGGIEPGALDRMRSPAPGRFGVMLFEGDDYRLFYVPDPEHGFSSAVIVAYSGTTPIQRTFDKVSMATAENLGSLGINDPYALVRFEVNCGDELNLGPTFVMTKVERLDGTTDYPLNVAAVMAGLMKQNEAYLAEVKPEIDKLLGPPAREVSGEPASGTGGLEPAPSQAPGSQGMSVAGPVTAPFIIWKDDRLLVKIITRYRATYYGWPCAEQTSPGSACTVPSMEATIDCLLSFVVNKDGTIAGTEKSPPARTEKGFLPPM